MDEADGGIRDISALVVERVGRCVERPGQIPGWEVHDDAGEPVAGVRQYLLDCAAQDLSPTTVKSYGGALLRWFRVLWALGVPWERASAAEVRDFVLWMRQVRKHRPTQPMAHLPGTVNARTGKRYLGDGYAPATINHNLSVIASFYDFHLAAGRGPVCNPVPARRPGTGGQRFASHHNPLAPWPSHRRAPYRQKQPKRVPRALPAAAAQELAAALSSDRDRALVEFYLSSGVRPSELLGLVNDRVDPGNQLIGVIRKGTRDLQFVPASPGAFMWLRLYQASLPEECCGPAAPVWWTLRRPYRPLNYHAARAMFRRANAVGGTNWTLHDLRHTAATWMSDDPAMPMTDVRDVLGHASITTTQLYNTPRQEDVIAHAQAHFARRAAGPRGSDGNGQSMVRLDYDSADLVELFGGER